MNRRIFAFVAGVLVLLLSLTACGPEAPTPTPVPTATTPPTATMAPAVTPTVAVTTTAAVTPTVAITPTAAVTPTVAVTPTAAVTPTVAVTPTAAVTTTVAVTPTAVVTPTVAVTPTAAVTLTIAMTPTAAVTPTVAITLTVAATPAAVVTTAAMVTPVVTLPPSATGQVVTPTTGFGVTPAATTAAMASTPAGATASMTSTAVSTPTSSLKVGLVTDVGGVNDKSFNQSAWAGVQKAMQELGIQAKFIESKQPTDYEKNIDQFATEGYNAIITVGFLMGDATAAKARQYPNIKFAIVDFDYPPISYTTDLKNVTSLMFQEDQVGFLAGVVAGKMTKTGTVCSVAGMEIPPVVRFVVGYQNGAKWANPNVKTLNTYIPSFTDPARGKEVGQTMIGQGCDVVFGVGGNTGNGGLLAAKEKGLMAIGVDVDQYLTYPEVRDALVTSAMKNVDVAVFNFLKALVDGTVQPGVQLATIQNNGVGLAPFHDWEAKVPQEVKDAVAKAIAGLKDGTIQTGYKP